MLILQVSSSWAIALSETFGKHHLLQQCELIMLITHNNVKNHLIQTYFHVSNLTLQNQTTNIILRFLKLFPHLLTHTSTLCKR
jgi:hypothetical protein